MYSVRVLHQAVKDIAGVVTVYRVKYRRKAYG